jgi:large subunit ribosomal protein L4
MSLHKIKKFTFKDKSVLDSVYDQELLYDHRSSKVVSQVIFWQLAQLRAGSASTKIMSEISGTTAKPYKQKGTGNARQGSKRSVQFVGGRTCHGPRPRSYSFNLPKKIRKIGLNDAIYSKLSENKVVIFDANNSNFKTSNYSNFFKLEKIDSALILTENKNLSIYTKNIKNIKSINYRYVNTWDIVNYNFLIVEESVFENILSKFKNV